ncbi:hypothetical protein [Methylomonas sp. CM2]|uniref:hypothetical protein n=1 Tax=Methylomonas sp. CM2 TaxID=3417647 RepID=UPI003CEEB2C0
MPDFLSRTANIWLKSEQRRDRFVLSGSSDQSIFCDSIKDIDGNISFLFSNKRTALQSDASKHFLQSFSADYDERGIRIRNGKLIINTSGLFKVGRFFNREGTTFYDDRQAKQGVISLYDDWITSDPTGKRQILFIERGFQEVMAFPLIRHIENEKTDEKCYEVIGFVSLHNDRFSNFSQDWLHTIHLANSQIVIALEQIGFIKDEESIIRNIMLHETKEDVAFIMGKVENLDKKLQYVRHVLSEMAAYTVQIPIEVADKLKHLEATAHEMRQDYAHARKQHKNLHNKLDNLSNANIYAFLGLAYNDNKTELISMSEIIDNELKGYKEVIKDKGIYTDRMISDDVVWKTNQEALSRILRNLLDNASKYALQNSAIEIEANHHRLTVINRSKFDESLTGSWPFAPGKRGGLSRGNTEGWGYGLCSVRLICEKILNWRCEFAQTQDLQKPAEASFSITIIRSRQ